MVNVVYLVDEHNIWIGSEGKGLEIMEHYFALFNQYNDTKISQDVFDLEDEKGNARGTKVIIRIPKGFKY